MRTTLAVFAMMLLALSLVGCDPTGPDNDSSIRGRVVDAEGDPVEGAALLLNYDIETPYSAAKPRTVIQWSLPVAGYVHLWVTDTCDATPIRTLVNGMLTAGPHETVWDFLDNEGLLVVEGRYEYHLEYDGETRESEIFFIMNDYLGMESAEGMRSFAVTNKLGYFAISQECLAFGHELTEPYPVQIIPPRVTLYAICEGYSAGAGPTNLNVDPNTGAYATIVLRETSDD